MMIKKGFILVLGIVTVFMALGGCASSPDITGTDGETISFGQITAIDGNNITVTVSTQQMPQMNGSQGTGGNEDGQLNVPDPPQGGQGNRPSGDTPQGDDNVPSGTPPAGDAPEGDNNAPDGMTGRGPGGLDLMGEEQTISITDSTVITVRSGSASETGTVTDLKVGDVVTVLVKNGTVTGITVMQMGMIGGAVETDQSHNADSLESSNTEETNQA